MPYRVDLRDPPPAALETLIELGALDVDREGDTLAALMPDAVNPERVARAVGVPDLVLSPATPRDDGSVWVLKPRPVRAGRWLLLPAPAAASREPSAGGDTAAHDGSRQRRLWLVDGGAFGTGLHPTTALCLEWLDERLALELPAGMLDVGVGSGVLALAALEAGVPQVVGIDIEPGALAEAAGNARLNGLDERLRLLPGGPEHLEGTWPLVVANVLAAPLIDMAPALVRRISSRGQLLLSGVPDSMAGEVERTYRRFGMRHLETRARAGWAALLCTASW